MAKHPKELNSLPARACGEPSILSPRLNRQQTCGLFLQNPASVCLLLTTTTTITLFQPSYLTCYSFLTTTLSSFQVYSQHSSQRDPGIGQTTSHQCPKPPMAPSSLSKGQSPHSGLQDPSSPGLFPLNPLLQSHWSLLVPWTYLAHSHPRTLAPAVLSVWSSSPRSLQCSLLPGLYVNIPLERPSPNSLFSPHPPSPYPALIFFTACISPDVYVYPLVFTACLLPLERKPQLSRRSLCFAHYALLSAQNGTRCIVDIQEEC